MLLGFFLPAELYSLRLYLPCNNIHICYPYFFPSLQIYWSFILSGDIERRIIGWVGRRITFWVSQRTVKWEKRQGWHLSDWFPLRLFTAASALMAGVMWSWSLSILNIASGYRHIYRRSSLPCFIVKAYAGPSNCGSRFSFIGLIIFVGTPTDSGRTLAIVLVVGVGSSFLKYWPRHCYVLSILLDPGATLLSHKCTTLLPLISIFSHVFKVEIWKALYKCYAEIILNWKIIMAF